MVSSAGLISLSAIDEARRVIAGTARSIRLDAPGPGTRPLADRVKQTLFAILEPDLPRARFLDLFAGSGAAGIEALSRGAAHATFVERDQRAIGTIRTNLARTGLDGADRATLVRADALAELESHGVVGERCAIGDERQRRGGSSNTGVRRRAGSRGTARTCP